MNSGGVKSMRIVPALLVFGILAGCSGGIFSFTSNDTTTDRGIDSGDLSNMRAGIWVDPNGCDHWIIDDGIEGYMTPRLTPDGRPVCREGAVPGSVSGDFAQVLIGRN